MSPYRIVLADDHVMFRRGIRRILEEDPSTEVLGEVNDGLELLEFLKGDKPDLVILDISMPKLRGIEATQEVKMMYPEIKILILSMYKNREYLHSTLMAGADGYLLKEDADTELFAAIETIRQGNHYVTNLLRDELVDALLIKDDKSACLTVREREVLKLIAEGNTNKEIGDLLFISVRTVEHHRCSIMQKLHLRNVTELVRYAMEEGYITNSSV